MLGLTRDELNAYWNRLPKNPVFGTLKEAEQIRAPSAERSLVREFTAKVDREVRRHVNDIFRPHEIPAPKRQQQQKSQQRNLQPKQHEYFHSH